MVVVAVAGGSGNVGRTIVETLVESGDHKVVVLGRKPGLSKDGYTYAVVDYANVTATAEALTRHGVQTVISTIQVTDEDSSASEVALIKAAESSSPVKRFIAAGWGARPNENSPTYAFLKASDEELRKTDLEWTRFVVGLFLDYYGLPHVKTHLPPITFAVDMKNRQAAIPGTGEEPLAFTYSFDVAKFVSAFLFHPKWSQTTYCYGERMTWNAFIQVAEEVTGSKFHAVHDPVEQLAKGQITALPPQAAELAASPFPEALARLLLSLLGLWTAQGFFDVPVEQALNQIFVNIKPTTVREMLLLGEDSK